MAKTGAMEALKLSGAKDKRLAVGEDERMGQSVSLRVMLNLKSDIRWLHIGGFGRLVDAFKPRCGWARLSGLQSTFVCPFIYILFLPFHL